MEAFAESPGNMPYSATWLSPRCMSGDRHFSDARVRIGRRACVAHPMNEWPIVAGSRVCSWLYGAHWEAEAMRLGLAWLRLHPRR